MIKWIERNIGWFIFIVLVISFVAPWGLTRINFIGFDFANTGQIGDTIGGITAPILNFAGIMLIYLTLKSQNESIRNNEKEIKNQRDFEFIARLINNLIDEIDKIKISQHIVKKVNNKEIENIRLEYSGLSAFFQIRENLYRQPLTPILITNAKRFYFQFEFINNRTLSIARKIKNAELQPLEKQDFYQDLRPIIEEILSTVEASEVYFNRVIKDENIDISDIENIISWYKVNDLKALYKVLEP